MIVVEPPALPVTVTEQVPPERVQVEEEKVTMPVGDCDHEMVPVGDTPVTTALQEEVPPIMTVEGVHVTVVPEGPVTSTVAYALFTPSEVT
ncbi:MAG: hypothetical protein OK438_00495 [Thaumarchaeota archaeon]|nr:hypothetical protein [Nitrososphaerota archaeon]